ncbi:glutathione peroxidase [Cytobacillus sp. Sa5YUA1]|uniref:Glutathione peroxidase n=1 Tax=Cytobacillus stercorigallinarum TaxID=2762240 RepID=A0ABR8QP14_9BACI|nr:glutathione peroxidase [Cytobacillus stercorigallinarum]MBD7937258.1 glutathione peroxidase [Cytobacillus stercorigallinarum]
MSLYDINVTLENGTNYTLEQYEGKVLLVVNTATKCGLAPQFEELESLYQNYKDAGLVILGFPSDQFKQELDSAEEASEACRMTYGVSFPMHEIIKVNGKEAHPLFNYLTTEAKGFLSKSIKWNFTKFLIDQNGHVVERFGPTDKPRDFEEKIKHLLAN